MSDFFELVGKRESCRNYSDKKVTREQLRKCIEAARMAPSACNSQPWSFIVVSGDKASAVAKCTQRLGVNKFTEKAPAFIVVSEEKTNLLSRIGDLAGDQQFAKIDIGIAAAHIVLAATEQGLSTCIMGCFDTKELIKTLDLPEKKQIRLIIAIGYSATDTLRTKKRKNIDEIASFIE